MVPIMRFGSAGSTKRELNTFREVAVAAKNVERE